MYDIYFSFLIRKFKSDPYGVDGSLSINHVLQHLIEQRESRVGDGILTDIL